MIIKNISPIVKQNTLSTKKYDLSTRKLLLNSMKLNNDIYNKNIGYNGFLLSQGKENNKSSNKNKKEKILKISGSADLGIKNRASKNFLSFENSKNREIDKDIFWIKILSIN